MDKTRWPGVYETDSGRFLARYRDADGQRHARTFATGKAAAQWKADREADVRRGDHVDPHAGRIRLEQWCETWLEARGVEESTAAGDRSRIDRHILPAFGRLPLASITRIKVQSWVRQLQRTVINEETGRTLAPATVHACVHLLSGMIRINPCADRAPRRGSRGDVVADVTVEVNGKLIEKAYPKGKARRTVPVSDRLVDAFARYLHVASDDFDGVIAALQQTSAPAGVRRAR